ncbi:MAG: hypothetical protein HOY44_22060 [Maritimibacter sp.]|uniref:hypothetical protein n=1 Tax=Maritimibacter sp. TaxID=2003363 RepID=UPI001D6B9A98|nr:hypothetical protein [Maritimibacter sp.]MBL6430205.1 hypothetical protein [Maritimibacter sp.]
MGLDFGFYRDHQEIHSVDGHGALFELFDSQIGGPAYDGYDDFLVTEETLDVASRKLALRLYRAGIADSPSTRRLSRTSAPSMRGAHPLMCCSWPINPSWKNSCVKSEHEGRWFVPTRRDRPRRRRRAGDLARCGTTRKTGHAAPAKHISVPHQNLGPRIAPKPAPYCAKRSAGCIDRRRL